MTEKLPVKPKRGSPAWFRATVETALQASDPILETVEVSPELATEILKKNAENRHLHPNTLDQYRRDMLAGNWQFNGEPILIARDGQLNDGQHRLYALIMAKQSVRMALMFGVDRESRMTLDTGAKRSPADFLAVLGVPNAALSAAIARKVVGYDNARRVSFGRPGEITVTEILDTVRDNDRLAESAKFAGYCQPFARGILFGSIIGFAHYVMSEIHPEEANRYLLQVALGENINREGVAWHVRRILTRPERITVTEKQTVLFKGWNAFKGQLPLQQVNTGTQLPRLSGDPIAYPEPANGPRDEATGRFVAGHANKGLAKHGATR